MHRTLLILLLCPGCLLGQSASPRVDNPPVPMSGKTVQAPAAGQAGVGIGQANGNEASAFKTQAEANGGGSVNINSAGIIYSMIGAASAVGAAFTIAIVYALIRMARAVWVGVEVGRENTGANRDTHAAVVEMTAAVRELTVTLKHTCRFPGSSPPGPGVIRPPHHGGNGQAPASAGDGSGDAWQVVGRHSAGAPV